MPIETAAMGIWLCQWAARKGLSEIADWAKENDRRRAAEANLADAARTAADVAIEAIQNHKGGEEAAEGFRLFVEVVPATVGKRHPIKVEGGLPLASHDAEAYLRALSWIFSTSTNSERLVSDVVLAVRSFLVVHGRRCLSTDEKLGARFHDFTSLVNPFVCR
jgi:hypothetical protein